MVHVPQKLLWDLSALSFSSWTVFCLVISEEVIGIMLIASSSTVDFVDFRCEKGIEYIMCLVL